MSIIYEKEISTKDGNLILDSHKLSHHFDRVQAWEAGERIAPVSVDISGLGPVGSTFSAWFDSFSTSIPYPIV